MSLKILTTYYSGAKQYIVENATVYACG